MNCHSYFNQVSIDAYLTFWAWSAESVELRLFRAVVKPLGGYNVLLSEIKDGSEMTIPADHEEYYPRIRKSENDHSPYTRFDLTSGSADSLFDASGGSAAGEGCVDLGLVGWDCNFQGYRSMENYDEFSYLRHQKNFHLEKVVKLNRLSSYYYMTFWTRSAESDEHRLF